MFPASAYVNGAVYRYCGASVDGVFGFFFPPLADFGLGLGLGSISFWLNSVTLTGSKSHHAAIVMSLYTSKDNCQTFYLWLFFNVRILFFSTQLDYFVCVSSIWAPYKGCLCRRFPRPVPEGQRIIKRWAAAGQDSTGMDSQSKECSVPRCRMRPRCFLGGSSTAAEISEMSSGCQIFFLVFG